MDSTNIAQIAVVVMAALSVGLIAYVIAYPYISGEKQADKRLANVTEKSSRFSATTGSGSESQEALQERRKQIEQTLKDIDNQKSRKRITMRLRLIQAGLDITPRTFYMLSAIAGLVVFGATYGTGNPLWVAGTSGLVAAGGVPRWLIAKMKKRRISKFTDGFANAIDIVVRGVKSGMPLNDCMVILAEETDEPLKTEFTELVEQQRVGVPLVECFHRMLDRVPIQEVNFFAIVIAIQQQAGGNLAEALGNLSGVLRDRKGLAAKVKSLSAEAKMSAIILGIMPPGVMAAVYVSTPEYISLLWKEELGQFMMMVGAVWMFIGVMVMRNMINFKY